jgi:hypothetical protein
MIYNYFISFPVLTLSILWIVVHSQKHNAAIQDLMRTDLSIIETIPTVIQTRFNETMSIDSSMIDKTTTFQFSLPEEQILYLDIIMPSSAFGFKLFNLLKNNTLLNANDAPMSTLINNWRFQI